MSLSFSSSQTDKSGYLLNRNPTPPVSFPSFHTSPLSDYCKFYFLKVPFVDILLPLHLHSTQHSTCSFTYSSFSVYHLGLPPSPPSAFRLTLLDATWDKFSSPVPRFLLSLFPGLTSENPLLPSHIGCHHFLSTLIVLTLSVSHINTQHADSHIQYKLE